MLTEFNSILNNLKLARKLTLLLLLIFIGGITFSGMALATILNYKAQNEISSKALLLLQAMNAVRFDRDTRVAQNLEARLQENEFLPPINYPFLFCTASI
jgi:predicted transposase YbfD/YdcC